MSNLHLKHLHLDLWQRLNLTNLTRATNIRQNKQIKKYDKDSKATVDNKWFKRDEEIDAVEFR